MARFKTEAEKVRRAMSPVSRTQAIERARDEHGRIICSHCDQQITDEQVVTIQHILPARSITEMSASELHASLRLDAHAWQQYEKLNPKLQAHTLKRWLNTPSNLTPLHNACHMEQDFNRTFTNEQRHLINLRENHQEMGQLTNLMNLIATGLDDNMLQEILGNQSVKVLTMCKDLIDSKIGTLKVEEAFAFTNPATLQPLSVDTKHPFTLEQMRWWEETYDVLRETIAQKRHEGMHIQRRIL